MRLGDYARAGLPVWPVKFGTASTRTQILGMVVLYALTLPMLTVLGATGVIYLLITMIVGIYWVVVGLYSSAETDEKWARKMFGASLVVLLVTLAAISVGGYLS